MIFKIQTSSDRPTVSLVSEVLRRRLLRDFWDLFSIQMKILCFVVGLVSFPAAKEYANPFKGECSYRAGSRPGSEPCRNG